MNEELKEKLTLNNKKISDLLAQNEKLMIENGYNPPEENAAVDSVGRIHFPSGYIRTADVFENRYHLVEIVLNNDERRNIAYSLQLSDFYNYFINRFYIWGSVETMLLKQDFINIVAVMESMVIESAKSINRYCLDCKYCHSCSSHLGSRKISTMKRALERLHVVGIISLTDEEIEILKKIYDLRCSIHVNIVKGNEFKNEEFTVEQHNMAITYLKLLTDCLYKECVPYYSKCLCGNKR